MMRRASWTGELDTPISCPGTPAAAWPRIANMARTWESLAEARIERQKRLANLEAPN